MKRILINLMMLAAMLAPALSAQPAFAAEVLKVCNSGVAKNNTDVCQSYNKNSGSGTANPVVRLIKGAIEVLSFIIGVAAVIGLIINGIRFMMASDSQSAANARSGLIYSLIGIAVTVLAGSLVAFVLSKY